MRQWGRPGRMRCSGKEGCGSRNGEGGGGRKQRMQRQRGYPLPLLLLLLSHFLLMLQAHMSLELGSSVGDCPRTSAHSSWPQFSFRGGERALEVPSYLPKKCGLFLGNRIHSLSVMRSTLGQSSCPTADSRVTWPSCFPSVPLRFPTCKIRGPRCMAFLVFHL